MVLCYCNQNLGRSDISGKKKNGLTWSYHKNSDGTINLDGTYKIMYENGVKIGTTGSDQLKSVVTVPSELDGYKVSAVMSIVGYENTILGDEKLGKPVQKVVIPDGVKEIAGGAFSDGLQNMNITKIIIPEGVTKIGEFAFSECRSLSDLYIPSTIQTIEYGAFDFCDNISFSGPGADSARYELENKYPTAKAEKENSDISNNAGSQADNKGADNGDKIKPGWNYIGLNWYYGNDDGTRKTGWLYNGGNWYYFYYDDGTMAHDTWIGNYYVNSNGVWIY